MVWSTPDSLESERGDPCFGLGTQTLQNPCHVSMPSRSPLINLLPTRTICSNIPLQPLSLKAYKQAAFCRKNPHAQAGLLLLAHLLAGCPGPYRLHSALFGERVGQSHPDNISSPMFSIHVTNVTSLTCFFIYRKCTMQDRSSFQRSL